MTKRKFYDWRYNTPAAIAERKQAVIQQTALERRKLKAQKEAEAQNLTTQDVSLQSDALLSRYEAAITSKRHQPTAKKIKPADSALTDATQTPPGEDAPPAEKSETPVLTTTTSADAPDFFTELYAIKSSKLPKHVKGAKINELKKRHAKTADQSKQERESRIQKSDQARAAQKKRLSKTNKSGQLKLSRATSVLLSKLRKSEHDPK